MNVDIWNYIHFIIPGAMAYALTDSIAVGVIVTLASSVLAFIHWTDCCKTMAGIFRTRRNNMFYIILYRNNIPISNII